jgi:mannosyltransferase OCH1-like enzyme
MVNKTVYVSLFVAAFVAALFFMTEFSTKVQDQFKAYSTGDIEANSFSDRRPIHLNGTKNDPFGIPLIIHQMWKEGVSPPEETVRWRKGCQALNPEFSFKMYNDEDIAVFTKENYPEYYPMLKSLKGVCKLLSDSNFSAIIT